LWQGIQQRKLSDQLVLSLGAVLRVCLQPRFQV
jgi:hypothetical protein